MARKIPAQQRDIVVIPKDEHDWEPEQPAKSYALLPWKIYDRFLMGESVQELGISEESGEQAIINDISQMRVEMRRFSPALTDLECDQIRRQDIVMRMSLVTEGDEVVTPQGVRVFADAIERRHAITMRAAERDPLDEE